jgi:hypothetical protein
MQNASLDIAVLQPLAKTGIYWCVNEDFGQGLRLALSSLWRVASVLKRSCRV